MTSIDKRPDGSYRARWREYRNGPQRSKHFARKIDAEHHLVKVGHDLLIGSYISPEAAQVTLEAYVASYLPKQPWREATREAAANALERHAIGFFEAGRPVSSIRKSDVQAFVSGLELAPSTVATVHQHLSGLLSAAVDDNLLAANPAKGVKLPQVPAGELVPLTADEVEALKDAAPEWFRVAVTLGAQLGLRQGEASGLTADRVDWLKERTVRVDRQWLTRKKPHHFGPLKSPGSYRTIPAPADMLAELGRSVVARDGFVLHREGEPVSHQACQYVWRRTVARAGLKPGLRFHELRHRFASVLISAGCSIVAVQRAMGHSQPSITLNLYGHLMPSDTDRIRVAIEASSARPVLRREGPA